MNKKLLFIPAMSLAFLVGCNVQNAAQSGTGLSYTDSNNYDSDPTNTVSDGGTSNDYDDNAPSEEEEIETPETFDEITENVISESGSYNLEGEYNGISITAAKGSVIYVFLNGATISSNTGIAFGSSKAITLYLVLQNGSVNSITNDFEDANAFHIKGEVHILGEGTLNIKSNQKNGLKVSKDLYVSGDVTLNVEGANHAISARSITANGVTINTKTYSGGKDGIQLECDDDVTAFDKSQGFAYLTNVNYTSDTYGDGIQAESYIYVSGGNYDITTHGVFVSYSSANMTTYDLETDDFKFVKSGSTYKRVAKDEIRSLSSSYYALANSVKGLKISEIESDTDDDGVDDLVITNGDYDIYIAHGATLKLNTTDDGVHTNYGDVTIEESNLEIDTYDDGVHADYNLNVINANIDVNTSYEALEGASVTIDGENTTLVLYANDDGINAASDLVSTTNIYIKDGYVRVYASGDGLDSNTALYLQGGTVIVEGPGSGNGSLDSDNVYFQGGIVFACSTGGMTERSSATQNTFLYQGNTMSANSKISIVDSESSDVIFSYTLKQSCNQLIFSSPSLVLNKSYKILSGTSTLATITLTSSYTTYGSSSGGPGGGGHGGPGGFH